MFAALTIFVIILLVVVDQLIKIVVQSMLMPVGTVTVIPNFFQLRYVENTGAAFGMLHGYTQILSVVTAVVLAICLFLLLSRRIKPGMMHASVVMLVAGGAGNLVDRILRGYVIDYMEPLFVKFAVFNFADCLVTIGAALLIACFIRDIILDIQKEKRAKTAGEPGGKHGGWANGKNGKEDQTHE